MASENYKKFAEEEDGDFSPSPALHRKKQPLNTLKSLFDQDEVLDDLSKKQMSQDWELLGRNDDWNSQNFRKWLRFYTTNASHHHEIDPETVLSRKNTMVDFFFLEKKTCFVEVFEHGQIVFTELISKKKTTVADIGDKVVSMKANKSETFLGLVYTNYMIFIELNSYSIINTINFHYQDDLKFAFNENNDSLVCLGCNLISKCGLSVWNIQENKFIQYTNNNFDCETITHVVSDKSGLKFFFIDAKKTLSVWYLNDNTTKAIEKNLPFLFESMNTIFVDEANENLIIAAFIKDEQLSFCLQFYSINNEKNEAKGNQVLLNYHNLILRTNSPNELVFNDESGLIKYDLQKKQEISKTQLDFGDEEKSKFSFFSTSKEMMVYSSNDNKIYNFLNNKLTPQYNLKEYKEESQNSEKLFKAFELDASINDFCINPFDRNQGALFSDEKAILYDFKNCKILKQFIKIAVEEENSNILKFVPKQFFVDPEHVIFVEPSPTVIVIQNIQTGKQIRMNNYGKAINTFFVINNEKILFCYNNEPDLMEWRFDSKVYKEYQRFGCELLFIFEKEIKCLTYCKRLDYIVVNLLNTSTMLVLDKGKRCEKVIELKGHTQAIENFEIIQNTDQLVSMCTDKKIVIWDLTTFEQVNVILTGSLLKRTDISPCEITCGEDGKYLAICKKQSVYVWDIQTSFLIINFQIKDSLKFLTLDSEKNVLYTFSDSCMFQKWILDKSFNLFTKTDNSPTQTANKYYCCTFNEDFKLLFMELRLKNKSPHKRYFLTWPNQTILKEIKLEIEDPYLSSKVVYKYQWTKNNEGVLFSSRYQLFYLYLSKDKEEWDIKKSNLITDNFSNISDLLFDGENYNFYLTTENGTLLRCTMNIETRSFSSLCFEPPLLEFSVNAVALCPLFSNEVALGSDQGDLIIFDFDKVMKIRTFEGHETSISYISYNHSGKKICSCSENSVISIWDISSETLETKLLGHKLSLRSVKFSPDDSRLLSCGQDSTIRLWNLTTKSMERLIEINDELLVLSCEFCNKGTCISAGFNECMIFNLFDFDYYIQQSKAIFLLKTNKDQDYLCSYFKPWVLNSLAFNFIHPFGFSLLHSLFYLGLFEEMFSFLRILRHHKCKFSFFVDCTNKNVIDLLIEKNANKLLAQFIEYLIEVPPSEDYISDKFHSSILDLVAKGLPSSEKLLDSRIAPFRIKGEYFSSFPEETTSFTTTIKNIHPCLEEFQEKFKGEDENTNENLRLGFQIVNLKNVCDPETNFCQKLVDYPNIHPIFKSEFAKSVIDYKWNNYTKSIHLKRFANFFIFTLVATLNSYYFFIESICNPDNEFYLYSGLVCEVVLLLFFFLPYIWYESKEAIRIGISSYFSEFWNWIDFFTFILFTGLICCDFCDIFFVGYNSDLNTALKMLNASFTFIMWLKALSFSIIYEGTAFIYTALVKIIIDLGNFLLLLFTLTVMLSFMIYILQDLYPEQSEEYDDSSYTKMTRGQILFICYKMILGDYDDFFSIKPTLNDFVFKIIFILVTILMFIILMNFIISLVGMVFSDVVNIKDLTYLYEKNKIIAEIDRNMGMEQCRELKKEKNMNAYLLICQTNISADFEVTDDVSKNQKNLPVDKTYVHTKIPNYMIDKIDFSFGVSCEICKKEFKEMEPQYYCYFCNIWLCAECGNKMDPSKKGSYSSSHIHNMVWIDVKNTKGMSKIDKYKLGDINIFEENSKKFRSTCNGCRGDMGNSRWICLSCRPGKYRAGGFVDFCENCMNLIIKKDTGENMKKMMKVLIDEDHDMDSHIYFRILFATSYGCY